MCIYVQMYPCIKGILSVCIYVWMYPCVKGIYSVYKYECKWCNDTRIRTDFFQYGSYVRCSFWCITKTFFRYDFFFCTVNLLIITHSVTVLSCPDVLCWRPQWEISRGLFLRFFSSIVLSFNKSNQNPTKKDRGTYRIVTFVYPYTPTKCLCV